MACPFRRYYLCNVCARFGLLDAIYPLREGLFAPQALRIPHVARTETVPRVEGQLATQIGRIHGPSGVELARKGAKQVKNHRKNVTLTTLGGAR